MVADSMPPTPPIRRTMLSIAALTFLLSLFAIRSVESFLQQSATWDEVSYLGVGKYLLQQHTWDVTTTILHPPLSYYISSIPLLLYKTDFTSAPRDSLGLFIGRSILFDEQNRGNHLLTLTRLTMVPLALLLGLGIYFWSYSLYGIRAAVLALTLFTFCPNMLAHAGLITPDLAITTFTLLTILCLWQLLARPGPIWALLGGLSLGAALLSKFTGLLLIPICLILLGLWRLKTGRIPVGYVLLFAALGSLLLYAGYQGHLGPYWQGIAYQREHAADGHQSFLLGKYSREGWWYYLSVAFLLKTPVAHLVLLLAAMMYWARHRSADNWLATAFLLVPAAVIFGFFSYTHQSVGLRYVLPIYPFLFIFAGSVANALSLTAIGRWTFIALVAWYVGASVFIQPHYLAYFNELGGGPRKAYQHLVDSNLDWGQELVHLKQFMRQKAIKTISLSYFGQDSPDRYGIEYDWLPSLYLKNPHPETQPVMPRKGWIAVSVTNLQGVYLADRGSFEWLKAYTPEAQLGYSMFVYNIR